MSFQLGYMVFMKGERVDSKWWITGSVGRGSLVGGSLPKRSLAGSNMGRKFTAGRKA